MGYSPTQRGYKCYDPISKKKKIYHGCHNFLSKPSFESHLQDEKGSEKFDRELKKLEWSINYTGARKEKSVVKEGGVRISTVR